MAVAPQLQGCRAHHGGNGEEEAEFRRSAPVDAHGERAHDGGARARHARNHRQALEKAHAQRLGPWQLANALVIALLREALYRENGDAADQQRPGNDLGAGQQHVDALLQQHTQHGGRNEGHHHIADKGDGQRLAAQQPMAHRPEGAPELHHHRQNGAQLDDDIEHIPLVAVVPKDLGGEDQVAGGGNRQKFGEPLDNAEQDGGDRERHAAGVLGRMVGLSRLMLRGILMRG